MLLCLVQVIASPGLAPGLEGRGVTRTGMNLGSSAGGSGSAGVAITGGTGGLGLLVAGAKLSSELNACEVKSKKQAY